MVDFFDNLGNDIKNGTNTIRNGISTGFNTVTGRVQQGVQFVFHLGFAGASSSPYLPIQGST